MDYYFNKKKDAQFEEYIKQFFSFSDDKGKIAYLGTLSTNTLYELKSYMKWQTAKAEHNVTYLQAENEAIQKEIEETEMRLNEGNEAINKLFSVLFYSAILFLFLWWWF